MRWTWALLSLAGGTRVVFEDLTFADGAALQEGVLVDAHYGAPNPSCPHGWKPPRPPGMANYTFRGIDARKATVSNEPFHFKGSDGSPIRGVYLEDVLLPDGTWECEDVKGRVKNGSVAPWPPCAAFKVV